MGSLKGLLILIASTAALPTGRNGLDLLINPTYKLNSPAHVVVEYAPGMTASAVQPDLFLRIQDPADPTSSLICKYLQNDYVVFFISPMSIPAFVSNPVSRSARFDQQSGSIDVNVPLIAFLKKENLNILPSTYRRINLRSNNPADPWELGAYALAPPGLEVSEYPEEMLAAPPPFFPSLCVSPDKPRPFPVLFAPSTPAAATHPSLASFSVADLTPAVAPSVHVAPAVVTMRSTSPMGGVEIAASPAAHAPRSLPPFGSNPSAPFGTVDPYFRTLSRPYPTNTFVIPVDLPNVY